jgi:hypothetical protein
MKKNIFSLLLLTTFSVFSQNATETNKDSIQPLSFQGYGEVYYGYDSSNSTNNEKSNFLYNHKRNNEININLAFVKASFNQKQVRANAALMLGNYGQYNLSTEPNWAQFIFEANVGYKVSKKQNIWLDAGIMPSHIGFESAISADCWTLSRSMLAENSPYYETGVKLSYANKSEKFNSSFYLLNGWQRINFPGNFKQPSFGLQLNYKPNSKLVLNYSNFLGNDRPDGIESWRLFHNLYAIYEASNTFGIIAGFDIGTDKFDPTSYGTWYSPVLIVKQSLNEKTKIAVRGEYYSDPKQIIISTGTTNGFQTFGLSSNLDYDLNSIIKFRIEGKMYHSTDKIFTNENQNYSLTTNMTIKF